MSNKKTNIIAAILLVFIFLIAFLSIKDDVFTFDETAHVAAGYSYLTQKDMRLNPEHPPLIKNLSALPLLFLDLNFPKEHSSWVQNEDPVWWLQFDFANYFLYHSGNNPDLIMFWSKIPMILLLVFLGWFLFFWAKKRFGNKTAILSLFIFSFSPTLLAHGRLVTTDVAAALGVVISTYFWIRFLENPLKRNIILAGIILGISLLFKFSLILLIPFLGIITIVYAWLNKISIIKYIFFSILAGLTAFILIIWPIYQFHIWNYPPQQQLKDATFYMETSSLPKPLVKTAIWMSSQPILRPAAHYLTGLLLAVNRSSTGHTTYFLGKISADGWKTYFPVVYLIKEPFSFHILTIIALAYAILLIVKKSSKEKLLTKTKGFVKNHFTEFSMIVFIVIYWMTSLNSKLNIGVRHLLPVFPFTILLVSGATFKWLSPPNLKIKKTFLIFLILWQVYSVLNIYPHFIAYFNELAGGPKDGHLYVVDSNLDWGQDLKRLNFWLEEKGINKIYIDYFGGGDAKYYLGEKYKPWWGERNPEEIQKPSYIAVSITQLKGGQGEAGPNYDRPTDYYFWIKNKNLVAKIGYSIFVYYID